MPGYKVRLREEREAQLMTQEELSKRSGVGESTLSRIESGRQLPRFSTIKKLAAALGLDPRKLIVKEEANYSIVRFACRHQMEQLATFTERVLPCVL